MSEAVPEFFSDTFVFSFSPYGLTLAFGARPLRPLAEQPIPPADRAIVRMSLEQAKILSMLLRKELNRYEATSGIDISLPPDVYRELGLRPDDWRLPD